MWNIRSRKKQQQKRAGKRKNLKNRTEKAKSANAGPFSRKIIKNRVQKAALMCYTKE